MSGLLRDQFSPTQCEAHWPIDGRCRNEGRVEVVSVADLETTRAVYCFKCVTRVVDEAGE